jgi:hypothetical protein
LKKVAPYHRLPILITSIFLGVVLLATCVGKEEKESDGVIKNTAGEAFAGSASCAGCHKNIYEDHLQTAHFLTSQPAEAKYIKGSFEPGKNFFAFNRSVVVAMEKRNDGFYQVEYFKGVEKKARRFDIVIGSGTMGQSFLNWRDNKLLQLPITYFTAAATWSNSPGFPDKVVFNRVITSRCLECHTTFAQTTTPEGVEPEAFDQKKIIYGVDCEKCHGPAAQHVAFQTQNPKDTIGKYIVNPARLSRQQNLDLCALCHGGRLQKTKPSFTFTAGNTLSDHFVVDTTAPEPDRIDVHGNQYGLLRASACFQQSLTLTCNSCHNTHTNEKGKVEIFSQRCMNCHSKEQHNFCPMEKTLGNAITSNCIDCHMPVKPSRAIAVFLPGSTAPTSALIRSHHIAVYPHEAKRLMPIIKEWAQKTAK